MDEEKEKEVGNLFIAHGEGDDIVNSFLCTMRVRCM